MTVPESPAPDPTTKTQTDRQKRFSICTEQPLTKQNWEEASVGVTRATMKAGIVRDDSKIKFEGHPAGTKRVRTGAA